jgi:AAA family ATP:ADP antiporter
VTPDTPHPPPDGRRLDLDADPPKSPLERLLGLAADVRAGEGTTVLLLALNGFLLLAAYYAIRPVRSALLLPVEVRLPNGSIVPGTEITAYLGSALAGLFLFIVPLYGAIATRVTRIKLINAVTTFFIVTLLLFFALVSAGAYPTTVAITFYLWIGVFSLMVIAQFWSFANDLYTPEQGKRLFAIVGFGGSVGAAVGALLTSQLARQLGAGPMMLIATAILAACVLLTNVIHARDRREQTGRTGPSRAPEQSIGGRGGFQLVLSSRYLLAIGLLTLISNLVNTNGNYILNATVAGMAEEVARTGGESEARVILETMAGVDLWQNLLAMAIQFFLVSRIFKYLGVGGALFVLPVIALGSYSLFALAPVLAMIRIAKIAENATDYSLQNTVRRALFLPTSREAKYKALQAVETFFWRAGDMLSSVAVLVFIRWFQVSTQVYAGVNIAAVAVWLGLAAFLARENRRLTAEPERVAA